MVREAEDDKHPPRHARRPTVGDRVRVKAGAWGEGRVFEITYDIWYYKYPYYLKGAPFGTWFSEGEVEWPDDASARKRPREDPASAPTAKRPRDKGDESADDEGGRRGQGAHFCD